MIVRATANEANIIKGYLSNKTGLVDGQFDLDINNNSLINAAINQIIVWNESYIILDSEIVKGIIITQPLVWDTQYFGVNTHRINYLMAEDYISYDILLKTYINEVTSKGYKHIVCRLPGVNEIAQNALVKYNFQLLIHKVMLRCNLSSYEAKSIHTNFSFVDYQSSFKNRLIELAGNAIELNRFYKDPNIPDELVPGVYSNWLLKYIDTNPEHIKVALYQNEIVGFYLYSDYNSEFKNLDFQELKIGFVGLIAVNESAKGLGKYLLNNLNETLKSKGFNIIYANTTLQNIASLTMFQNQGYKMFSLVSEYSLHIN